jgi:streptogramin lyase
VRLGNLKPYTLALDNNGTPWFAGSANAAHVTSDGRVIRFQLPIHRDVSAMAWGADNALWISDEDIGGLTRMTPDGHVSRFAEVWGTKHPFYDFPPGTVIPGPDGRIWLADRNRHRVVSVAADGSVRVVARLLQRVDPDLMATAPDGSVWFLDLGPAYDNPGWPVHGGIGRILPDGSLEPMRYRTHLITAGTVAANGDLWFLLDGRAGDFEPRTNLVHVSAAGRVTQVRTPIGYASAVTVSPDGAVWIAGAGVARMNPGGRLERIRRPGGWQDVNPIVAAPDGRIWLIFGFDRYHAAWLPPNPCLSRRQITMHLRARARPDALRRRPRAGPTTPTTSRPHPLHPDRPPGLPPRRRPRHPQDPHGSPDVGAPCRLPHLRYRNSLTRHYDWPAVPRARGFTQ